MTTSLKAVLKDLDEESEEEDDKRPIRTSAFLELTNLRTSVETKVSNNTNTPTANKTLDASKPSTPIANKSENPLVDMWQSYKDLSIENDPEEPTDAILRGMGFLKYAEDLNIKNFDSDNSLLLIAWKLEVNQQHVWEISKEEFQNWSKFGVTTIDQMKKKCGDFKSEIAKDATKFKNFYFFVFDYLREEKKLLATEEVIAAWEMLDMRTRWPLFSQWLEFIKTKQAVSRDEWRQLLAFMAKCNKDFKAYSTEDVWPTKYDEFVELSTKPIQEAPKDQ